MDQLTDKQRKIIRLANKSDNPELRRRAVRTVTAARTMQAGNYAPEFLQWAKDQGQVFTNSETGNLVRWNSLPSKDQAAVHTRYDAGDYEDKGGPGKGGGAGDDKAPADGGDQEQERGQKHTKRKELRGIGSKKLEDEAGLSDQDLGKMLPLERLQKLTEKDFKGGADRIINGFKNANFNDLESFVYIAEYLATKPDDPYSKDHWLSKNLKLDKDEVKTFHKELKRKTDEVHGRKYGRRVLAIANANDLESEDADAVYDFRKDKPPTGRKLTPEQLKQKFLQGPWGDAETKKRVRGMDANEFMAMRNAIFDEDEEEISISWGKTASHHEEKEEEDKQAPSLFERPPGAPKAPEKTAGAPKLTKLGRRIVRMAYNSTDAEVRTKLVRRAKAELA